MSLPVFLVFVLATWRVASLLVCEDGPSDIFKNLRASVCNVPLLRDLLGCVWCCSLWVAAVWAAGWYILPIWSFCLASVFALSAGAVIIQQWMEEKEKA